MQHYCICMKQLITNIDFWGSTTSILCAFHCAALPILLSFGIISTHSWMNQDIFEFIVIGLTFIFVYFSLLKPYLETRSNPKIVLTALAGLFLIGIHHFIAIIGTPIVVIGGLLIAWAHILNHRQHKHTCQNCNSI